MRPAALACASSATSARGRPCGCVDVHVGRLAAHAYRAYWSNTRRSDPVRRRDATSPTACKNSSTSRHRTQCTVNYTRAICRAAAPTYAIRWVFSALVHAEPRRTHVSRLFILCSLPACSVASVHDGRAVPTPQVRNEKLCSVERTTPGVPPPTLARGTAGRRRRSATYMRTRSLSQSMTWPPDINVSEHLRMRPLVQLT